MRNKITIITLSVICLFFASAVPFIFAKGTPAKNPLDAVWSTISTLTSRIKILENIANPSIPVILQVPAPIIPVAPPASSTPSTATPSTAATQSTYKYKILTNASVCDLNKLGADSWTIVHIGTEQDTVGQEEDCKLYKITKGFDWVIMQKQIDQ